MKILVIIPDKWNLDSIRYLQGPITKPLFLNMEEIPTPLEAEESWMNYKTRPVKKESKVQLCDACDQIAVWSDYDEWDHETFLCGRHMRH